MNYAQLLHHFDRLEAGFDPATDKPFDADTSCLRQPDVAAALQRFQGAVRTAQQNQTDALPDTVLLETYHELVSLGYRPTPEQIVRVIRGSRSIGDGTLKAVSTYGKYRSRFAKSTLTKMVSAFAGRYPELFGGDLLQAPPASPQEAAKPKKAPKKPAPAYKANPFFRESAFDKMDEAKAAELKLEVDKLGFQRPSDKLPAFKQRARQKYPRAYEPWSRPERALLIEAMCYTNDAEKIATLFGRTANSVTDMGLRLIYDSQRRA